MTVFEAVFFLEHDVTYNRILESRARNWPYLLGSTVPLNCTSTVHCSSTNFRPRPKMKKKTKKCRKEYGYTGRKQTASFLWQKFSRFRIVLRRTLRKANACSLADMDENCPRRCNPQDDDPNQLVTACCWAQNLGICSGGEGFRRSCDSQIDSFLEIYVAQNSGGIASMSECLRDKWIWSYIISFSYQPHLLTVSHSQKSIHSARLSALDLDLKNQPQGW
jgi:hypothetical protein